MGVRNAVINRIYELCNERNMAINALANIAGVTPSTIYGLFHLSRKDMGIVIIKKICDGLEITLAEFFDTKEFNELEQEIK